MKRFSLFFLIAGLATSVGPYSEAEDDPRKDGWQTEAFAEIATRMLTELASEISLPTENPSALESHFHDHFEASFPASSRTRTTILPFAITKTGTQRQATDNAAELTKYLRAQWSHVSDLRFHFKVLTVTPKQSIVETRVLVSIDGKLGTAGASSGRRPWEQHSEWTVKWSPSSTGSPRIAGLHIHDEQTATVVAQDLPLFKDRTTAVIGATKSYQQQLAYGQPHWLRRIESFHGMLNPGQNGISIGDINGDGLNDLYVCQPGGLPNIVYTQNTDGTMSDQSRRTGLDLLDNTHSALIVDLDNDGDQDVVLATAAAVLIYENANSRFSLRHTDSNMSDAHSMAAADYDKDGDLDLYACGYFPNGANVNALPIPIPYFDARNGGANRLLQNDGDWNFSDVTASVGLNENNRRFSYAVIWVDFDNDGDEDLYVANDFGPDVVYRSTNNAGKVQFVNASHSMGIRHGAFGMSVAAADLNRDGLEDIYVANMFSSAGNRVTRQPHFQTGATATHRSLFQRLANGNSLLMNDSGEKLSDTGVSSGTAMGRWSWGANFADLNNDGWDDLLVTNGYITGESEQDS